MSSTVYGKTSERENSFSSLPTTNQCFMTNT